jgi:hypothetical protein
MALINPGSAAAQPSVDPKSIVIKPVAPSAQESHQPAATACEQVTGIVSPVPLSAWTGSVTIFNGFTGTLPAKEIVAANFDAIASAICSDQSTLLADKINGRYFVPCALKEAPLIGTTLEKAQQAGQPTVGKMRSKQHMTEASMLVVDVDGLSEEAFQAGLDALAKDGLTYLAFTTHSYGNPEKPGMRARLIVPVDRPLGDLEYRMAWHGFNARYFGGAA